MAVPVTHEHFVAPRSLEVDDLTLRSWRPGDGAVLAAVVNASLAHLRPWMDWADGEDDPAEAEVRVRQFAGKYLAREDFVLSIWQGDELVGGTGFHPRWGPLAHGIAEVGMWISASQANRGLGTRVLTALTEWGFSDAWGWRQLLWLCDRDNVASARVAEKAGYALEGEVRGTLGRGTPPTPEPGAVGHAGARTSTLVYGLLATDDTAG
jgi:RimJ/RimL family protein N-acetyltransferase